MENKKYCLGLSSFSKFGPAKFKKLNKHFQNFKEAFLASQEELIRAGIESNIVDEFISFRNELDLNKLIEITEKENIKIITLQDKNYPKLLSEIHNPPPIIYYKGNIDLNNDFLLSIVGTRKYSQYGKQAASEISLELAKNKITIVSGMALGIDSISHHSCLEAGGKTIAVLGSGLDYQSIYPSSNRGLAEKIIDFGGAIISEFPPGTKPLKYHFPQRNRIISGLSLGTIVIEAGIKSGSLITAYLALEQNREVFALPGSIYSPNSAGTNKLIKQGARPITSIQDILDTLNFNEIAKEIKPKKIIGENDIEQKIIDNLSYEAIHIDEIARLTKLDTSTINSTLIIMEMKGMVKNLGGMQYVLSR